jgi:hypothetical protein
MGDSVMAEGDVTINLPRLYRGITDRLKESTKDTTYAEGWNDALYLVLDILDGQEPIAACIDEKIVKSSAQTDGAARCIPDYDHEAGKDGRCIWCDQPIATVTSTGDAE